MKIKHFIIAASTIMPMGAMAGPCDEIFGSHNCLAWAEESIINLQECSCGHCPSGTVPRGSGFETHKTGTYNNVRYTLHSGCAVECSCANNPNPERRGGTCEAQETNMTAPDYSTCTATPTGAKLCNTTTNKCNDTSVTIAGQIYCKLNGQTCSLPFAASAMLASPYCSNGAAAPQGGVSCLVVECKQNAIPGASRSNCMCNTGYYMNTSSFTCEKCPNPMPPATTSTPGATDITQCYIPAGATLTETAGTYKYIENCSYTE